ncbi:MAG TPA: AfsR/SARP family transcriptional regulator, partial [Micromonosporaceae bacterium]
MEFRLLGPFDVVAAGSSVDLGPPKQRVLLAGLAVDAGRRVSPVTLIDRIWDGTPPREATNVLHTYMSRIRRVLRTSAGADAPATVERNAAGYRLVVDAENVDLRRFSALADRARALRPGDPQRAALLGDAVRLWRGEALAGLPGAWAARVRQRLREQRLNVVTTWAEAELDAARYPDVLEVLEELVAENPLVESLIALLMRTLTLAGRDAEALEAFARIRQRIAAELGTEPGPDLRALHAMLLRGRASGAETIQPRPDRHPAPVSRAPLSSAPVSPAPFNAAPIRPAQLPPEVHGFTGR